MKTYIQPVVDFAVVSVEDLLTESPGTLYEIDWNDENGIFSKL